MILLVITKINLLIPTTTIGLLAVIAYYLYFYFKNKDKTKLETIQSLNPEDKIKAIEMVLNDLGVTIDTSNLTPIEQITKIRLFTLGNYANYLFLFKLSVHFTRMIENIDRH